MKTKVYTTEEYKGIKLEVHQMLPSGWFFHPIIKSFDKYYFCAFSSDVIMDLKKLINKIGIKEFMKLNSKTLYNTFSLIEHG